MNRGILLDIEGTTTPIAFVYTVLFPYARRHMAAYVGNRRLADLELEFQEDIRAGNQPPGSPLELLPYLYWLMDQDRKSTALKRIQGEIWLEGFRPANCMARSSLMFLRLSRHGMPKESTSVFSPQAVFLRSACSSLRRRQAISPDT
jgi:methionine salvage enolase-phosphatase E1